MTKKELVKIIRTVVKHEIKNVLNEQTVKQPTVKKQQYSKNTMLNEVLNDTAATNNEEEWPSIDANTLRSKFAAMQGGAPPMTDLNNRPVDVSKLDPTLNKALTRDYSDLVKRF